MTFPSIRTCPAVGSLRPARRRRSVLFPAPLGPSMEILSPFSIESDMSSSAEMSPGYLNPRFRASISGAIRPPPSAA
ncbi:MAG: hypothetical protein QXE18_07095 [Thermoplasmata archaeon]